MEMADQPGDPDIVPRQVNSVQTSRRRIQTALPTPESVELFKELARSESGHRNGLRRVIRSLQEAATAVVLYCPLCGWELDFGPVPAEGAEVKCRMCPGRFALRLDQRGDWTLERLAP